MLPCTSTPPRRRVHTLNRWKGCVVGELGCVLTTRAELRQPAFLLRDLSRYLPTYLPTYLPLIVANNIDSRTSIIGLNMNESLENIENEPPFR